MTMADHTELVLTAIGPDRPGLVSELTGYLRTAGVNVAERSSFDAVASA